MPGRFYYSPIDSGSMLHGIADGIERGVDNLDRGLQTARQVRRQEAQDARQQLFDDMEIDDFFRARGGARGAMPTVRDEIQPAQQMDFPGSTTRAASSPSRAFTMQDGGEGPVSFDDFLRQDRAPVRSAIPTAPIRGLARPDPRFQSAAGGLGYVMTPEALEDQTHARAMDREAAAREAMITRSGPMAAAISGGRAAPGSPEYADAALRLSAEGLDPEQFQRPEDRDGYTWRPRTEEEDLRGRGRDATGRDLDTGSLNPSDALDFLRSMHAVTDEEGYVTGYDISEEEMYERMQRMTRGEGIEPEVAESAAPSSSAIAGAMAGYPKASVDRMQRRARGDRRPSGTRGQAAEAPAPETAEGSETQAAMSDADVQSARAALQRYPRREWQKILEEEGATADEIRRILDAG